MPAEPLIVTLLLDDVAQQHYDDLRRRHFPPQRNYLAAHVTLFHALPGDQRPAVQDRLAEVCRRPGFPVEVTGVRFLGRGVAYLLQSEELSGLRAGLAVEWQRWLRPQDRQRWQPHITVQNKVPPATARALYAELAAAFQPAEVAASGLGMWRYLGGPWEPVARCPFGG